MEIGEDFVTWLKTEVVKVADKYQVASNRAFPAWAFSFLFEQDDDDAFNQTETLTQGDAGLDGWLLDAENSVLHLAQAKFHADVLSSTTDPDGLRALLHAALLLRDPAAIADGAHKDKLLAASLAMSQAMEDNYSISLDFLVAGKISDQTKKELRDATAELGAGFSAAFYDVSKLYETWLSQEPIGDLSGVKVRFLVANPGEHYNKAGLGTAGVTQSAIAALDGRSIADAVSARCQALSFERSLLSRQVEPCEQDHV